jgi:hypothetical protein
MTWTIEYYEQQDRTQPAEDFEDQLDQEHAKLAGKLIRAVDQLAAAGPHAGAGLVEKCSGYPGLWEIRAIFSQTLARELFGFDGNRVVLLTGYVKRAGEPASTKVLDLAAEYWRDYQRTHRVSPEQPEEE